MNQKKLNYNSKTRGIYWGMILMVLVSFNSFAQSTVTGTVTDEFGVALLGATVIVQGTSNGTVTDFDGKYSIAVSDGASQLVFSYVGFLTQTIEIGGKSVIDATMEPDAQQLSEVVIVGYGTQLESQITGSIGKADTEEMARVASPTVGQALQGRVAGVFIKNQNGQPGSNKTNISIRGFGTPLYIVDGLPVDESVFSSLNPNDIEELNVLKDAASAAVYGARAGNGVVLVTTKRGTSTGDVQFSYKGDIGFQGITFTPESVDSWEHFALINMNDQDNGRAFTWAPETVQAFKDNQGLDDENYPSVNMYEEVIRNNAPMATHNLSLRGGGENVRYFISGQLFEQEGLEQNVFGGNDTNFERYTIRGNLDVNVTDKLDVNLDMSYIRQDFIGPRNQFEGTNWSQGQGIFARSLRWRPFHSIVELPGGHRDFPRGADAGQTVNPLNLASADIGGSQEFQNQFIDIKLGTKYQLTKGISTRAILNYQTRNIQNKLFQKTGDEYRYNTDTMEHDRVRALNADTRVEKRNDQFANINFQYFLQGDHKIGEKHTIKSMYVFEFIQQDFERVEASRINYEFPISQLSAGPPSQQLNSDDISISKRMGHIGRISYNYDDKYSLEVSARYDGNIKFPSETRWGLFPSVSGAWNISEESWFDNADWLRTLKLRASWGRLGFDGEGDFQFLSTYSFNDFIIYDGNNLRRTIVSDGLINPQITWEKMDIINFGLDFNVFDGKLEGNVDVYQRHRFDVLGQRLLEIPPIVGADLPLQNFQEFKNKGIELGLRHSNRINNNFNYSIGGNIGLNEEIIENTDELDFINKEAERRQKQIGQRSINGGRDNVNRFYLETDGLFSSQEQIDNWADIDGNGNRSIQVGDIRPIDRNKDGRITDADKYLATSGTTPRLTYGLNTRIAWKGFELSSFWQGASKFAWNLTWSEYENPFPSGGTTLVHHRDDAYVPENQFGLPAVSAADARWPRASGRVNADYDTYLINGAYLRLKQLQFSYTFNSDFIDMLNIKRLKVYAGGTNLITFSDLDFLDPEIDEDPAQFFGNYHPQTRVYNFGLEIDF
ncbi:TonB-dependent receptor [Aurantibacter crassamenti]|uniref:SusC/RagA family TonB-linked outer membrane protein n=1 Tax=Aurantibacter crassamenti TaxID=1837375 RepID=UPI00193A18FD|nr:TonB-dependent receptor [Aurantibacter crassamenti]MBM1105877.1 TonB-dependent receptor [Aurantibacter crassamenti]